MAKDIRIYSTKNYNKLYLKKYKKTAGVKIFYLTPAVAFGIIIEVSREKPLRKEKRSVRYVFS